VSLWNYKSGRYYHSNCYFEGSVDFVCPRGWCYIRDSRFYELKKTAAIWHAGSGDRNQKLVIRNSYFDGVEGFYLGRHHYDAQFFLMDCGFSENMADIQIFRVLYEKEPQKNRPNIFGNRYYYYNCHRKGGDFEWFGNNLEEAEGSPLPEDITAEWTFNGQWDPELKQKPYVKSLTIKDKLVILQFNELISVKGALSVKTHTGKVLEYETGSGRDVIRLICEYTLTKHDFDEHLIIVSGIILPVKATAYERALKKEINLKAND
jgi:pectinesterase